MQQSSPSVGALAAALAKAQAAIANPEKSLTATIVSPFPREEGRTFRYAPLASGLDLVRKCLGQHEIATVQTTAIDRDTNLIRLTTTLLHASGEWVSSEWPVCPISETAAPHRLGAALTYARRYALFTLVGIAGEDDLDAPDLSGAVQTSGSKISTGSACHVEGSPPASSPTAGRLPHSQTKRSQVNRPKTPPSEDSVRLRDKLVAELEALQTLETISNWARRALPLKNQLSTADARSVEDAFAARLNQFNEGGAAAHSLDNDADGSPSRPIEARKLNVTVIAKPVRERDRHHLRFVASQPCLVCGRTPSDAHHIKFAEQRAMGRKVSDKFTVPICRLHHRDLHRRGNERVWWEGLGIDPLKIAAALWDETHAVAPSEAGSVEPIDTDPVVNGKLNGRLFETKSILRPVAG